MGWWDDLWNKEPVDKPPPLKVKEPGPNDPPPGPEVATQLEEAVDQLKAANSTIEEALKHYWGQQ